ncbi:MAG TPA: AraC family transcriptional regulator [Bacteroidia bacterium]|nr:AraC family transcriptional regulator [Bacteroidia bacterium]HNU32820.1 AraC family transcriptional regulator [Bacteroidia bacterium]
MLEIKSGLLFHSSTVVGSIKSTAQLIHQSDSVSLHYIFPIADSDSEDGSVLANKVTFTYNKSYLQSFDNNIQIDSFFAAPEFEQDICCNTQLILHEISTAKWTGALQKIFLESKALALLMCFKKANTTTQLPDCTSCKFLNKPIEKEKILKAREIILSRISSPPTIQELSLEIGMNQCYLKKGFKEVFSVTVYDFIITERMNKAKMLLLSSDLSVSEIAGVIGFSSVSSFSNAFKKFAGVFPSELQSSSFIR